MRECGKQANVVGRAGKINNLYSEIKKLQKVYLNIEESEGYKNEDIKMKKDRMVSCKNNF